MANEEKLTAKGLKCLFSGKPTITPNAKFLPGYDAKMKSLLLKIIRSEEGVSMRDVRKDAIPFLESPEGLVGFRLKGDKLTVIGKFSAAAPVKKAKAKKVEAKAKGKKVGLKIAKKPVEAKVGSGAGFGEEEEA